MQPKAADAGTHWQVAVGADAKMAFSVDGVRLREGVLMEAGGSYLTVWAGAGTEAVVSGLASVLERNPRNCWKDVAQGTDYRGDVAITRSSKPCQKWTAQAPHPNLHMSPVLYPEAGLGDHAKCRNPDGKQAPWCFTTDPDTEWEYCNVGLPDCFNQLEAALVAHWPLNPAVEKLPAIRNSHAACCTGQLRSNTTSTTRSAELPTTDTGSSAGMFFSGSKYIALKDAGPLMQPFSEFTISLWLYATSSATANESAVISRGARVWELLWTTNGSLALMLMGTRVGSGELSCPRDGRWHFVSCSFRGDTPDGSLVDFNVDAGLPVRRKLLIEDRKIESSTAPVTIGSSLDGGKYFEGRMRDVRVHSRALSVRDLDGLRATVECSSTADQLDARFYQMRYADTQQLSHDQIDRQYREVGMDQNRTACPSCCPGTFAELYLDVLPVVQGRLNLPPPHGLLGFSQKPLALTEGIPMSEQLSIAAWLKQEPINSGCIVSSVCFNVCFNFSGVHDESYAELSWRSMADSPRHVVKASFGRFDPKGWQHLALAVDGKRMVATWFLNGKQQAVVPLSNELDASFPGQCADTAPRLEFGSAWIKNGTEMDAMRVEPSKLSKLTKSDGKRPKGSLTSSRRILRSANLADSKGISPISKGVGKLANIRWYNRTLTEADATRLASSMLPWKLETTIAADAKTPSLALDIDL
jgi:hypothetical protein